MTYPFIINVTNKKERDHVAYLLHQRNYFWVTGDTLLTTGEDDGFDYRTPGTFIVTTDRAGVLYRPNHMSPWTGFVGTPADLTEAYLTSIPVEQILSMVLKRNREFSKFKQAAQGYANTDTVLAFAALTRIVGAGNNYYYSHRKWNKVCETFDIGNQQFSYSRFLKIK